MSIIQDGLEEMEEAYFLEILKDFIQDDDFILDPWRPGGKVFDYRKCIKRVIEIAKGK